MLVKLARNWASPEAFYEASKGPHEMPDSYRDILPSGAEIADGPVPKGPAFKPAPRTTKPAASAVSQAPKAATAPQTPPAAIKKVDE